MVPTARPPVRARAVALLPLAALLASCAGGGGELVLGFAAPLQESYGQEALRGAELAVAELAAGGRAVRLVPVDDGAGRDRAIAVADSLAALDEVVAVVGHVNSGTTIAAAPHYAAAGLPAVATSATSPAITELGEYTFRVASSDAANARRLAAYARREMGARAGVLYANDDYGRGLAGAFAAAFREAGGTVVQRDPYLDDSPDLRPYLRRLARQGVDLVFLAGLDAAAARIIDQAREVGLDARFLGGDGLEGLRDRPGYDGVRVGVLFHRDAGERAQAFARAYEARYGAAPSSYAATAYDAVLLLARAAADGGASREGIRRALARVGAEGGTPPFEGASGTLRFDANGDPQDKEIAVGVLRDGTIQLNGGGR